MDESYLSWLRLVPGVSANLARALAERYPDPELLKGASAEDLAAIPGMGADVAARVLELIRTASTSDAAWYRDEPSLYLCPECGSFAGKGSKACPFCGVVFDDDGAASTPASAVEELLQSRNGDAKICTRCGAFLEPGAGACRMCGTEYAAERLAQLPAVDTTPIPEEELSLCTHCGAYLAGGAAHCVICATAIGEERIRDIARNGKGVSKGFLTRWQKAATEGVPTVPPAPVAPRTLVDELRDTERLIDAEPTLEQGWASRARVLVRLGLASEAVACFERAGRISPDHDAAYRQEAINALGPTADLSILPARWAPPVEAARPAPEPRKEPAEIEREVPVKEEAAPPPSDLVLAPAPPPKRPRPIAPSPILPPIPPAEATAIRRAIAYYSRLLEMDAGMRVAWQTKGELLLRLGRKGEADACFQRAADLEIAEREFGRAALSGLQTRGPVRPVRARGGTPWGRTNGRVNGLTNGRHGRTNGRVNGLTNGTGATNGLMSGLARGEGQTNGLVNGNGFTNGGRGTPQRISRPAGLEWTRSLAGVAGVVLLMILAPILASMLATPPPVAGIAIDGSFGDWARVPALYADPAGDASGNPDIDLVAYKATEDSTGLSLYAKVTGVAFQGAAGGTDVLVALIDADGRADTGYDAGRLGAEYAIELVGWDSRVRDAPLSHFRPGANRTDWFGFESAGFAQAASSGSEVEFAIGVDLPRQARILLASVDSLGRADVAEAVVAPGAPALSVRQRTIAPDIITVPAGVGVLRLDLSPTGLPVSVTGANVSKRGSLSDSAISLSLYADDGDGTFTPSDARLGTSAMTQGRATFPLSLTLDRPATWFVVADLAALPMNETFGLALGDISAGGEVSVAASDVSLSYLGGAPPPTVDGAFADWASVPRSTDIAGDVANRSGVPALVNANIDLTEVGSFLSANATFYLRVDGTMLGGIDIPNLRGRTGLPSGDSDADSVPDGVEATLGPGLAYDFNNDNVSDANANGDADGDGVGDWPSGPDLWLNTTIPAWYPSPYAGANVSRYIGPVAPRTLEGVDSAIVYIDGDNRTGTGLAVTSGTATYGLDWAVVVVGRHGTVRSSELYQYRAGPGIPWDFVVAVPGAVDTSRLEVSVPASVLNLSAAYRTLYYATDWQLSFDTALPVPPGRSAPSGPGTRSPLGNNVVINEISSRPNPEWIELANPTAGSISLAGWTLQLQRGSGWTTIYTFPLGSTIGAWGSGLQYLVANLAGASLPNGGGTIRLQDATATTVDLTSYPNMGDGSSWSRFKDPTTGKPMDSDNDNADFYVSATPTKGAPNDRHRPTITVAKTANKVTAAPGDSITYTIYYNNTNTGRSNHVWINDTLPAQVTYTSASAAPTGNSGQNYFWHFTNVAPNSLNLFTVTVSVNAGVANGVSLVNRAVLEYTDQLNQKMTGSSAWRNLTVSRPVITVAKIGDKATAVPGDTIVYTIFYNNTGSASAQDVWINDTLPADVTFLGSSAAPSGSSGQTYRWHFTAVGVGPHSFTITVSVNLNATSSLLVNWVFLNYTTQNGYPLPPSSASWTTSIPEFSHFALVALVPLLFLGIRRIRRGRKE